MTIPAHLVEEFRDVIRRLGALVDELEFMARQFPPHPETPLFARSWTEDTRYLLERAESAVKLFLELYGRPAGEEDDDRVV